MNKPRNSSSTQPRSSQNLPANSVEYKSNAIAAHISTHLLPSALSEAASSTLSITENKMKRMSKPKNILSFPPIVTNEEVINNTVANLEFKPSDSPDLSKVLNENMNESTDFDKTNVNYAIHDTVDLSEEFKGLSMPQRGLNFFDYDTEINEYSYYSKPDADISDDKILKECIDSSLLFMLEQLDITHDNLFNHKKEAASTIKDLQSNLEISQTVNNNLTLKLKRLNQTLSQSQQSSAQRISEIKDQHTVYTDKLIAEYELKISILSEESLKNEDSIRLITVKETESRIRDEMQPIIEDLQLQLATSEKNSAEIEMKYVDSVELNNRLMIDHKNILEITIAETSKEFSQQGDMNARSELGLVIQDLNDRLLHMTDSYEEKAYLLKSSENEIIVLKDENSNLFKSLDEAQNEIAVLKQTLSEAVPNARKEGEESTKLLLGPIIKSLESKFREESASLKTMEIERSESESKYQDEINRLLVEITHFKRYQSIVESEHTSSLEKQKLGTESKYELLKEKCKNEMVELTVKFNEELEARRAAHKVDLEAAKENFSASLIRQDERHAATIAELGVNHGEEKKGILALHELELSARDEKVKLMVSTTRINTEKNTTQELASIISDLEKQTFEAIEKRNKLEHEKSCLETKFRQEAELELKSQAKLVAEATDKQVRQEIGIIVQNLEMQLVEANKTIRVAEDAKRTLERSIESMSLHRQDKKSDIVEEYESKIEDLESELAGAMKNYFQGREEIRRLQFDLSVSVNSKKEDQRQEDHSEVSKFIIKEGTFSSAVEIKALQEQLAEITMELSSYEEVIAQLTRSLKQSERECNTLSEERLVYTHKIDVLNEEVSRLEHSLTAVRELLLSKDNFYFREKLVEKEYDWND